MPQEPKSQAAKVADVGSPQQLSVKAPTNVVRKTSQYNIFKHLEENRLLDERIIEAKMRELERNNLLEDLPIVVTKDMVVLEGAHRLEAASRLSLEVHYKIASRMTEADVPFINSAAANWKLGDYIEYWIKKGHGDYIALREFAEKWGILPYNALGLLSGNSAQPGSGEVKAMERGEFIISNLSHAESVMEHVQEFSEFMPYARSKAFMNALVRVMRLPSYEKEDMIKRSRQQKEKFTTKFNDVRSWLNLLEEIANHRRPAGQAVNFRVA